MCTLGRFWLSQAGFDQISKTIRVRVAPRASSLKARVVAQTGNSLRFAMLQSCRQACAWPTSRCLIDSCDWQGTRSSTTGQRWEEADLGKSLSPRYIQVQGNVSVKSSAGLHEMRLHPRTASSGCEGAFPINHHQGSFPEAASVGDVPTSDGTWVPLRYASLYLN